MTQFPVTDLIVWGLSTILELWVLRFLNRREPTPLVRSLRLYVMVWLALSFGLFGVSQLADQHTYALAYFLGTALFYAADMAVLVNIAIVMRGKSGGVGPLQLWAVMVIVLSGITLLYGDLKHPATANQCYFILFSLRQVGGVLRVFSLLSVALYGALMASSWKGDAGIAWFVMLASIGSDFLSTNLSLEFPHYEALLAFGPTIGFVLAMILCTRVGSLRNVSPRPVISIAEELGVPTK